MTKRHINKIAYDVLGCAMEVSRNIGPGLLESIYHEALLKEMSLRGMAVKSKVPVPVKYKGSKLKDDLILDILVEDAVVVELKSVEALNPVHQAQVLTYMKLTEKPKGLLINFNSTNIHKSTIRLVNEYFRELED